MAFWLIAGVVAMIVVVALAGVLLRRVDIEDSEAPTSDMQVYRDQLKELERDVARGTVAADMAERTRVEIARRLLEADRDARNVAQSGRAPRGATYAALALLALVILGGGYGMYTRMGAPGYVDMPLKARIAAAEFARDNRPDQAQAESEQPTWDGPPPEAPADYLELVTQLRVAAARRPDDLQGQSLLATHEAALGNYVAAHQAMARVLTIRGDDAQGTEFAQYADLLILAAGGYVSPEAENALSRALQMQPENPVARYYSGLLFAQTGRPDMAFRVWRILLEQGPDDAPWMVPIRSQIDQLAALAGVDYTPPAAPDTAPGTAPGTEPAAPRGPSAEDIEAAGEMTEEERLTMIDNMVTNLSDRLATEGGPATDWARLIGALGVMGETARATAAWNEAVKVFQGRDAEMEMIRAAADEAGVDTGGTGD